MSSRSTRSGGGGGGGGGGARGTKRARTDDDRTDGGGQQQQFKRDDDDNNQPRGRPQLLLNTDELRKRTGKKYCDEAELVPLLLAHGLIRRVRTIAVEVRPLSGESFDIKLNAKAPTVGEAKEQIERDEGTKPRSQLLAGRARAATSSIPTAAAASAGTALCAAPTPSLGEFNAASPQRAGRSLTQ